MRLSLDRHDEIEDALLQVLRLLVMLGQWEYTRSILSHLAIIKHGKDKELPTYTMVQNHLGCCNEEAGEISFGCLARQVTGSSMKAKFQHVQQMFQLLPTYRAAVSDIEDDVNVSGGNNGHKRYPATGQDVANVGFVMSSLIRSILNQSAPMYTTEVFKKAKKGMLHLHTLDASYQSNPMVYVDDISHRLKKQETLLHSQLNGHFGSQEQDVWDAPLYSQIDEVSDDENAIGIPSTPPSYPAMLSESEDASPVKQRRQVEAPSPVAVPSRVAEPDGDESQSHGSDSDSLSSDEPLQTVQRTYVIDKILAKIKRTGGHNYLVQWEGFDEPEEHRCSDIKRQVPDLVREFEANQKASKRRRRIPRLANHPDPAFRVSRSNAYQDDA